MNRKSATIKSFISAIKAVLNYEGIQLNEDKVLLSTLVKACWLQNDCVKPHLPIHKGLLKIIVTTIDKMFADQPQPYLSVLYKALYCTAYFGLFRVGDITESHHVVKAKDVHIGINKKKLMFVLHSSKMHGKSVKLQIIKIDCLRQISDHSNNNAICPFQALKEYLNLRQRYRTLRFLIFHWKFYFYVNVHWVCVLYVEVWLCHIL